jgi:inosine/xanthosine triphosphatase
MKKLVIASKNPVKLDATLEGFRRMFPEESFEAEGIAVPSEVSNQPRADAEVFRGARQRVENAARAAPDADFWVGIEGGIEEKNSEMEAFAWVVIKSKDGRYGKGRTGTFFLPKGIAELLQQGKELGEANDAVFGLKNSGQESGAVGALTGNVIDRTAYYVTAVMLALIPFRNERLYNP